MILCFGDSITEGKPGVSYVKYLGKNFHNYGLGGDTVINLKKRIETFMGTQVNSQENRVEKFIIQIGTNDILLPFLMNYSSRWSIAIEKVILSGRVPSKDILEFEENYREIAKSIGNDGIYVSIPCIGEDLENELNKKVDEYNTVIKKICMERNLQYIDFNSWQKAVIGLNESKKRYFISKNPLIMVLDSLFVTTPLTCSIISKVRNLKTTIDGVHLNTFGAKKLAKLILSSIENTYRKVE
jgi:lysophospholipase L1-like esterase